MTENNQNQDGQQNQQGGHRVVVSKAEVASIFCRRAGLWRAALIR